ncbi:MAG: serine/threonine-protein kinase [Planctomycetota bacterium]
MQDEMPPKRPHSESPPDPQAPAPDQFDPQATLPPKSGRHRATGPSADAPSDRATDGNTRAFDAARLPQLGNFRLEEKIGEGGMGVVYRAYDPDLQRYVALKKILPKYSGDTELWERFLIEARSLAAVVHPNIAQIYSIHAREAQPFFVMEYVDGESSQTRVERAGPVAPATALDMTLQAARGLSAAYRQGIIHRDVKPSNLVIASSGVVKLVDFGLSRPVHEPTGQTDPGVVLGTPHYTSPEQSRGGAVDHRSDIYSLGCTLYYLLGGEPPFNGKSQVEIFLAHAQTPPPRISARRPDVALPIDRLLARMLAKRPEDRFQNYDELVEAISELLLPPETELVKQSPRSRRRSTIAAAMTLLVLLTGGIAAAGWWRGRAIPEISPAQLLGDVFTSATRDDPFERLEYVFARYKSEMPSGVEFPARTLRDDAKRPGLIGKDLRWSNFKEYVVFPQLVEFDRLRITGLRFAGEPDFELVIGHDPHRPQDSLRVHFSVGRENRSRNRSIVECRRSGKPEPIELKSRNEEFTIEPNTEYQLRLTSEPCDRDSMRRFALRIDQRAEGKWVERVVCEFELPAVAVPTGSVALRCAGLMEEDWTVFVQEVMIRGRLDRSQLDRSATRGAAL